MRRLQLCYLLLLWLLLSACSAGRRPSSVTVVQLSTYQRYLLADRSSALPVHPLLEHLSLVFSRVLVGVPEPFLAVLPDSFINSVPIVPSPLSILFSALIALRNARVTRIPCSKAST